MKHHIHSVLRTETDGQLNGKVEVVTDLADGQILRLNFDYGSALNLHAQLGAQLGLTHEHRGSPMTASRPTTSPRRVNSE